MQFSYFDKGIHQKIPTKSISASELFEDIQGIKFKSKIDTLRELTFAQPDTAKQHKKKLPFITISGEFTTLDTAIEIKDKLIKHSGLIVLDFDNVTEPGAEDQFTFLEFEKERLSASPYCYAIFISPSGTGLKMVCKIEGDHLQAYIGLEKHIAERFTLQLDPSGKDVTRRCFISHDPDIYINENAEIFPVFEPKKVTPEKKEPTPISAAPSSPEQIKDLKKASDLAAILVAKSIDITANYDDWMNIGLSLASLGEPAREIFQTISSVYEKYNPGEVDKKFDNFLKSGTMKNAAYFFAKCKEVGIYGKKTTLSARTEENKKPATEIIPTEFFSDINIPVFEEVIVGDPQIKDKVCIWQGNFWLKIREMNKEGRMEITHKFKYVAFRKFLQEAGFSRLINQLKGKGNTYEFIRTYNNIVKSVNGKEIRELVDKWIRINELTEVEEDLTRGSKTYFGDDKLDKIPAEKIEFKRDTETEAFYYFRNCFVKVTKEGITPLPYTQLDSKIWLSQINDHDFTYIKDNETADFSRFLMLAVNATENAKDYDKDDENGVLRIKKLKAVHSGIGYSLHGYKDPAKTKSFDIYDKNISRDKSPEGGSGKSLTFAAISKVIPSVEIDATTYKDENAKFDFSNVSHDTRFVYFNDAHSNFPFKLLFNVITNSITIKRLYLDPITLDAKNSPKVGVNTNYIIKGDGGSFRRRMFDVEYSDFFNDDNTPIQHFKRRFFEDGWDKDEWNNFYSFMFDCVQDYLAFDLIPFPAPNFEKRKLIAEVRIEFVEFIEDPEQEDLLKGHKLSKDDLFEKFRKEYHPDFEKTTKNTLTKWLAKTANYFGFDVNPFHKNNRDREGGIDFVTLVKKKK